jgi:tRNA (guanosine-2'-O-)-methyltransferase
MSKVNKGAKPDNADKKATDAGAARGDPLRELEFSGNNTAGYPADAWDLMNSMLTESRRGRIMRVCQGRTQHIRLVVQDVHDPHNISACLRSADAFGIQHCHVVNLKQNFRTSTVARGVGSWLTLHRHQSVEECVAKLRADGFRLYAGVPATTAVPLHELPVDDKIAVVFGNEHAGIDSAWLPHMDRLFTIPMFGMVESLNISVGAAITMQHLTHRARETLPEGAFNLSESERQGLLNKWICDQLQAWPQILPRLRAGKPNS